MRRLLINDALKSRNIASNFVYLVPSGVFGGKVRWLVRVSPSCFRVTVGVPPPWAITNSTRNGNSARIIFRTGEILCGVCSPAYQPLQSNLKWHARHLMHPFTFASSRDSPQRGQVVTSTSCAAGVPAERTGVIGRGWSLMRRHCNGLCQVASRRPASRWPW